MIHELAHILLRDAGLCVPRPEDVLEPTNDEQRVEVFCNQVAGSTLVPTDSLLSEPIVVANRTDEGWQDAEVQGLADRYGVSREVILRRLLGTHRISESFYRRKVREIREEYARAEGGSRREGFPPPYRVAVSSAGPTFVKLVLNSYYGDHITASDVADFLDVRLKHLPRIESEVLKSAT
jgi:Zn-dependent peptidase ImmA (M78 family)